MATVRETVLSHFPDCPPDKVSDMIFSCTAFPFVGAAEVNRQFSSLKDRGAKTWEEAMDLAEKDFEDAWEDGKCREIMRL